MSTHSTTARPTRLHRVPAVLRRRWPIAVGLLAAAAIVLTGPLGPDDVAVGVAIAVSCYLAAVAFSRPWMAWAWCLVGTGLVVASRLLDVPPLLTNGVAAVVLVGVGIVRGAARPALARQTAGLVLYGALVLVALSVPPGPGLAVAALALLGHGAWDLWHLRSHRGDVSPSLAEACVALDVPAGVAVLLLAFVV
ncbi:hypothetical protein Acsp06_06030 [Actinomycetospora sp. NBRC 106375]|uniref:hypothetical protein n=1 Tax=Actinomycetospora sp. NBRC 106375 TaxID=3032207 RepID=UPI0024A12DCA|nr:hypothetical protein [Actinomycetospora sp. NBRC 106375]GLZ44418.1 hypothetical protein Acsp06_06030 [Actinomycetospora sp. NBRC 106375]